MVATITPRAYAEDPYTNILVEASRTHQRKRLLVGVPTTGLVRMEWVLRRYGQQIPCNWSHGDYLEAIHGGWCPLGFTVHDARNIIVQQAVEQGFEWLFFNDHDTIMPYDCFDKMNTYMLAGDIPVVAGLYTTKSHPPQPLAYRGRGNSYFRDFHLGEKVWVDGCGLGCTLLSVHLLKCMWQDAPAYQVQRLDGSWITVHRVFETPAFTWHDPEIGIQQFRGTEDLSFFDRMMHGGYLAKAGFRKVAKKKYPILLDASIVCMHIDQDGTQYPLSWSW